MTEWLAEHWLAVTLFALYTTALMRNALSGLRVSQSMRGFYVGNRNLSGPLIGLSFFATFASTNSYIGHAGKGYEYGLPWMVMPFMLIAFTYISWRWIGPRTRLLARNFDALTLPDFLAARFLNGESDAREPLRVIAAFVVMFCSLLYLVAIFKGAGHLFERFFNVPYQVAIGLALIIVMLYTSIGGFVSVVRTDALQGVLMMIGAVLIFYFVTSAAGGVSAINQLSVSADKQFLFEINGGIPFVVLLGISLSGSLKLIVDPRQTSRFFALKDDAALRSGMWVAIVGLTIVQLCLYPIGIYAHLLIDGVSDTDLIVPTLVNNAAIFPIWAGDFLFVAIVAAAMSSMDSVLLVAASTGYKNLVQPALSTRRTEARRQVQWTRLMVIALAIIAAGLALEPPGDILQITIFSGSLYAVCFLPAVVFGLYWSRGSSTAVLASMAAGITTLIVWLIAGYNTLLHEVFPALAVSIAVYVACALGHSRRVDLDRLLASD
jgi:sodium/pantothenate symporter